MSNHDPKHIQDMSAASAAARRVSKIAGLIATAPPLAAEQVDALQRLLAATELRPSKPAGSTRALDPGQLRDTSEREPSRPTEDLDVRVTSGSPTKRDGDR